jgi:hypothetical protein
MIFTSVGMLNRCGTVSTTGVGVGNHRVKNRRSSHMAYKTLFEITNFKTRKNLISETFNIHNNNTWIVSHPDNPSLNFTIQLNSGVFNDGAGDHTLQNDQGLSGSASDVYFMWVSPNESVKQSIQSIDDVNNTITWVLSEVISDRSTIVWIRQ